jgi:uncharacterized protein
MALDSALLRILACPVDKGSLIYLQDEMALYNPRLRRRYQITGDVPVMLAQQAETVSDDEHTRLLQRARSGAAAWTMTGTEGVH